MIKKYMLRPKGINPSQNLIERDVNKVLDAMRYDGIRDTSKSEYYVLIESDQRNMRKLKERFPDILVEEIQDVRGASS